MKQALSAWLAAMARGGGEVTACGEAAEAHAGDPWQAIATAGALARCETARAEADLGLDARLRVVPVDADAAVARVSAGQPFPAASRSRRRARGAWDTPPQLARALLRLVRDAPPGPTLDPACGAGALLLAAREAGRRDLHGGDTDPRALAVARVALPGASLALVDAHDGGEQATLVLTNPPFVSPEHQDKAVRQALTARYPWLVGRFDLAVPFLAAVTDRLTPGGQLGMVVPEPLLVQPYGAPLRERWLREDRLLALGPPAPFPGASVRVRLAVWGRGGGPAPMPWPDGPHADELLSLPGHPLDDALRRGDAALAARVRRDAVPLGTLCRVDTGVVSHGPGGGKARLLHDGPGDGRVPYVDAADLGAGRVRWLSYEPDRMHRPKHPGLFAGPKLLVQRLRGRQPLRVWLDRDGRFAGHTLLVAQPLEGCAVPIEQLEALLRSPEVGGLLRLEKGARLDVYPADLRGLPVPRAWLEGRDLTPSEAFGLSATDRARLAELAGH